MPRTAQALSSLKSKILAIYSTAHRKLSIAPSMNNLEYEIGVSNSTSLSYPDFYVSPLFSSHQSLERLNPHKHAPKAEILRSTLFKSRRTLHQSAYEVTKRVFAAGRRQRFGQSCVVLRNRLSTDVGDRFEHSRMTVSIVPSIKLRKECIEQLNTPQILLLQILIQLIQLLNCDFRRRQLYFRQ